MRTNDGVALLTMLDVLSTLACLFRRFFVVAIARHDNRFVDATGYLRVGFLFMLIVLFAAASPVVAEEYGFRIKRAELVRENDEFQLNADIKYGFSDTAIEALRNGVPLTLDVRIMVMRERRYVWSKTVVDSNLRYRILYRALANMYQVVNETSGVQREFASMPAAIDALGELRDVPVMSANRLAGSGNFFVGIKSQLNIEALPLPLRPVAYVTPQWHLASNWFTWHLEK